VGYRVAACRVDRRSVDAQRPSSAPSSRRRANGGGVVANFFPLPPTLAYAHRQIHAYARAGWGSGLKESKGERELLFSMAGFLENIFQPFFFTLFHLPSPRATAIRGNFFHPSPLISPASFTTSPAVSRYARCGRPAVASITVAMSPAPPAC
jgi:hypothetical protein